MNQSFLACCKCFKGRISFCWHYKRQYKHYIMCCLKVNATYCFRPQFESRRIRGLAFRRLNYSEPNRIGNLSWQGRSKLKINDFQLLRRNWKELDHQKKKCCGAAISLADQTFDLPCTAFSLSLTIFLPLSPLSLSSFLIEASDGLKGRQLEWYWPLRLGYLALVFKFHIWTFKRVLIFEQTSHILFLARLI